MLGDVMAGLYALLLLLAGKSLIPQKSIDKTCIVKENIVILQQQIPPRFPFEQRTRAELRFYRPQIRNRPHKMTQRSKR